MTVNAASILEAVTRAIEIAKALIDAGRDAGPIITNIHGVLAKGRSVTQADLDAIVSQSDTWSEELQRPIPPEEP